MLLFFFFFLSLSLSLLILHSHNIFSTINASLHLILLFIYFLLSFFAFPFFSFPFHLSEQVCIKETNTSTYQLPPSPPLSSSLPFFFSFSLSFPFSLSLSLPFPSGGHYSPLRYFHKTLLGHSAEEAVIDVCMARDKAGSPWSDAEKVRSFLFLSSFPYLLPFHFVPLDCLL